MSAIKNDPLNAFCAHLPPVFEKGADKGPLSGLTFAAKDLFAIKGHTNGAGNPDWLRTHGVETEHADTVAKLLDAGADLVGKTHTDELAFSLNGENHFYGTPINPKAPDRIPGGSSSGSASAVSGELVDFALGTDTGGSVRVPASYCGIFGIRTTHGRVSKAGLVPLAPSSDVPGWFARDTEVMARVGQALLGKDTNVLKPERFLILDDMFEQVSDEHAETLLAKAKTIAYATGLKIEHARTSNADLQTWFEAFRMIQVDEVWQTHKDWITEHKPVFGPGIKERFDWAARSFEDADKLSAAKALRETVRHIAASLCDERTVLVLPPSAGPAPLKAGTLTAMDAFRTNAMRLTCFSGLSGFPQVSMPTSELDGLPIGLSFMTAAGTDQALLDFIDSIQSHL